MSKNPQTAESHDAPTASGLAKIVADRRAKRDRLRDEYGLDPYGHRIDGIVSLGDARGAFDAQADAVFREGENAVREAKKAGTPEDQWPTPVDDRPVVRVAGRVMQHRVMGNLIFMSLRDASGDMQVAVSKKQVGQPWFSIAKQIDLSDLVAVQGPLGMTNTGEVTVWAEPAPAPADPASASVTSESDPLSAAGLLMLTKSLAPPPGKHHGLTDPEQRYRKRYVDLHTNPQVMRTMQQRIQIIDAMRDYLRSRGFIEVETPMLQTLHGGAAARPFETHHNALDLPLTLRIAPELYLKRLLVGGMTKVFEINRNFRNEGISPRHNPEFTMLEAYEAYGSWETMADLVEDMVCTIARKVNKTLVIDHSHDAEGLKAIESFFAGNGSIENICIRRLNLIQASMSSSNSIHASDSESYAISSASEGYDTDQPGFARLVQEYADMIEDLDHEEARKILKSKFVTKQIDLTPPWPRVSMAELVKNKFEWVFDPKSNDVPENVMRSLLTNQFGHYGPRKFGGGLSIEEERQWTETQLYQINAFREHINSLSAAEKLVEVYEKLIEPTLINPTFVTRVPSVIIPLAKKCADDPYFADVYELAINGVEISPGYTELNDPDMQEQNFRQQVGDEGEKQAVDEDFLEALRVGMPPAGGIGLGIDRLVMMLTGAESIRDVILFPLMKPQVGKD